MARMLQNIVVVATKRKLAKMLDAHLDLEDKVNLFFFSCRASASSSSRKQFVFGPLTP